MTLHTVVVKGNRWQAFDAADRHRVDVLGVHSEMEHETVLLTDAPVERLAQWLAADVYVIPGFGFPVGSALLYSEVKA